MALLQKAINTPPAFKFEYLYVLFWIILNFFGASNIVCNLLLVLGFFCVASLIKKTINFQPGLLLIIFISFYLVYLIPVFTFNIPIGYHTLFNTLYNYHLTLSIFILFLVCLTLFFKNKPYKIVLKDHLPRIKSFPLFFLFLIIQIFIIIQAMISGASIVGNESSYEIYASNLSTSNGLWEYFYLIYFLAYLFAPNKYCKNHILILIFLIYSYVSLTRGYRIQLIEMIFLFFILYLDGKAKTVFIIGGAMLGLVAMELYGFYKLIGTLDIEYITKAFQSFDAGLISNQTEVFYSTTAVIALQSSGYLDWSVQLQTFFAFILNFIVPTVLLWHGSRVLDYMSISDIGGGGYCFGYFYFWFGILGVIGIAYFIAWNLNNNDSKNKYKIIYLILLIALCPRWFAYEPTNNLIRLPLTLILIYMVILKIFKRTISDEKSIVC